MKKNFYYHLYKSISKGKYVFLTLIIMNASLCVHAQNQIIKLSGSQTTVSSVIKAIQKQTGLSVDYSQNTLNTGERVNISSKTVKLSSLLDEILSPQGLGYEIQDRHVIVTVAKVGNSNTTQPKVTGKKRITGHVVDSQGEPIIGASIIERGTSNGTVTDLDGNFSIEVKNNSKIAISYIGYSTREYNAANVSKLSVAMHENDKSLEEVVVVGYGVQKKSSVTGAIVSTAGKELAQIPTTSVSNTLAGRMPGLIAYTRNGEPGYDDAGLLIRGVSTTGNSSPLVVVDGVADRAGGFSRIDPNDIESISVLKDASAAIYGSRAANGVILVTTKRGQSGGKISFHYTGNVGFSTPTILPEMCNSWQYATLRNEIRTTVPGQSGVAEYTDEQIQKYKDGTDPNYPNIDIWKKMVRPALQTQHNFSINGSTKTMSFYASGGYQYQDNYYKNSASNYNQYNLRSNLDITPNKNVKIGINLSARQEDRNSPITGSEDIWRYLIKYDPCVNLVYPGTDYPTINAAQDSFQPLTGVTDIGGYQKNRSTYLNADVTLHLETPYIVKGLSFDAGIYLDRANTFYRNFKKKFYLYGSDGNGNYTPTAYGPTNASLDENMSYNTGITFNARINYKTTIASVHNISAFVAYEQYTYRYDYLQGYRENFVSTQIDQLFAGDKKTQSNTGTANEAARQNYFGRVDYDYNNKYLFEFNWRYDGSENFPKGNRFGFFPGVSLGWRISEENFWKEHIKAIDYLKIRASWGEMGNDNVDKFQYITAYTFSNPAILNGSAQTGVWLNRTANPNITWEVADTYDVGLEAKFLRDFNFEFDWFYTKRNNILATRNAAIPEYAGLKLPDENIGKCSSRGFEVSLGWNKRINSDWSLRASGNFSYAKSRIDFIDEPSTTLAWQRRTGNSIGTDGGMYLMYQADGIFRTKEELAAYPHLSNATVGDLRFCDINNDKVIDAKDKVRQDKPNIPRMMFGINLGVQYKNWSLQALFQGAAQVWQYTFMEAGIIGNFTKDFFDNRWTANNPNSKYPKVYNRDSTPSGAGDYRNTFWLDNASYLRLKSLDLAYTLPKKMIQKIGVENITLAVTGYNLFTITGLKNNDPEITDNSQGWAAWVTPQSKVINFRLDLTF